MSPTVLCATDFSDASDAAVVAARDLSRMFDARLLLVHVFERLPIESATSPGFGPFAASTAERAGELENSLRDALSRRLAAEAIVLAQRGARIEAKLLDAGDRPWEAILDMAEARKARLIVMGTHGRRGPARWLLGSVAERTVRVATCPVVVVPAAQNGRRGWPEGRKELRVLVAADPQEPSPIGFLRDLRSVRPCEVTVAHLFWPPAAIKRHRILPFDIETPPPEMIAQLEKDLRAVIGTLPGTGTVSFVVRAEWGRVSDALFAMAQEIRADLLVVGVHKLEGTTTPSGVLKRIQLPVAFVPSSEPVV